MTARGAAIMAKYMHERPEWPKFRWEKEALADQLAAVRHRQGRLIGRMESLGFSLRDEAVLQILTRDVLTSSEIEGEILDPAQVRSSIARRLGMDISGLVPADRDVEGVVEMMLDATQKFNEPLTDERLFAWHASLFPTGRSGMTRIRVGAWRDESAGPTQVVSGPFGKEKVHYQAPDARRLDREMKLFLEWFSAEQKIDPVLKSGIAHLWFVSIHPFDDGNGRIALGHCRYGFWLDPRGVRSASTACQRKSGRNEMSITRNWKQYRSGILISPNGCAGIWTVWIVLSKEPRRS